MAGMLMALGELRFSVEAAAYDRLRDVAAYRWTAQDRLGRTPALQYLGPGERTVELDGTIYPHHRGGLGQVDRMRALAALGEPLLMVSGRGDILGLWAIARVEEDQSHHLRAGEPRKQTFRLALQYYGEDA